MNKDKYIVLDIIPRNDNEKERTLDEKIDRAICIGV